MEQNFEEFSNKVLEQLRNAARTETVIGEQFTIGEFTCVPIIKMGLGFGGGSGNSDSAKTGKNTGGGLGGGVGVEPVAFLVTRGSDIKLLSVGKGKSFETLFEKMPDVLDKVMDMKKKKNADDKDDE